VLLWLDPIARRLGGYTAYTLGRKEFVGIARTGGSLRRDMLLRGYEPAPRFLGVRLQATKKHPVTGDMHDWSLRRVDRDNQRMQYHVHAWERDDCVEVFSHWEFRPDIARVSDESWDEMQERLQTHFAPVYGQDYVRGQADAVVSALTKGQD